MSEAKIRDLMRLPNAQLPLEELRTQLQLRKAELAATWTNMDEHIKRSQAELDQDWGQLNLEARLARVDVETQRVKASSRFLVSTYARQFAVNEMLEGCSANNLQAIRDGFKLYHDPRKAMLERESKGKFSTAVKVSLVTTMILAAVALRKIA